MCTDFLIAVIINGVGVHAQVAADTTGVVSRVVTGALAAVSMIVVAFGIVVFPVTVAISPPRDPPVCGGTIVGIPLGVAGDE